ncbi:hypothetical protein [Flavobacterium silvaticum]|uniref:Uncharacterized protein n=1 Tax=Flavobacterium silvaticum TaxID=1852020 RepID=A0A972FN06_9FLAO|nr:hypothetical protein [Flavobacterium silvaticum]NMH28682.1 hypothetical protein [Flavobacterium silvaticum]
MDITETIEIVEALAAGRSPLTGEMLVGETILNDRTIIRALQIAIDELKKDTKQSFVKEKKPKDEGHKEIDYFQQPKFNTLNQPEIDQLKKQIGQLGIVRIENLPESIVKARILYPRAYEAWSVKEKELLGNAMEFTNDLEVLSDCFQRGKGSMQTMGQKLLYAAKQE